MLMNKFSIFIGNALKSLFIRKITNLSILTFYSRTVELEASSYKVDSGSEMYMSETRL